MPHGALETLLMRFALTGALHKTNNKENGDHMKSRKHLKTVLFVASLLAVGTTMGAALLIERQGGGSQAIGKQDQSRGAVGRPTHSPTPTSTIYGQGQDTQNDAVASGHLRWNPPGFVSWPQGASGGGYASGWTVAEYEWPEYAGGRYSRDAGYNGATYTIVAAGPDNTAAGRVSFNRGTESPPSMGSLFTAVPASLSQAPVSTRDVVTTAPAIAPPVPEPAEWTMLIAGLLFIGALTRRRNRRASAI
jgi:hypothetical protein